MDEIQYCTGCNKIIDLDTDAFYPLSGSWVDGEYIATDEEDEPYCGECADELLNNK